MAYWRPDGLQAFSTKEGGILFLKSKNQRMREYVIPPNGCVSVVEAAHIVHPPVSRVAVQKWIKKQKLKAIMSGGEYLITLSDLRRFAQKHGYAWAPLEP